MTYNLRLPPGLNLISITKPFSPQSTATMPLECQQYAVSVLVPVEIEGTECIPTRTGAGTHKALASLSSTIGPQLISVLCPHRQYMLSLSRSERPPKNATAPGSS